MNQPKTSALKHYKLEGFSVERLMHFATALEHDVIIEIRPRAKAAKKGRTSVADIRALAKKYQVSETALNYRLMKLGLVSML